jgi:hypothetical protein
MACPIPRKLDAHFTVLAVSLALEITGNKMPSKIAMMPITINSSTRVNPLARVLVMSFSPFRGDQSRTTGPLLVKVALDGFWPSAELLATRDLKCAGEVGIDRTRVASGAADKSADHAIVKLAVESIGSVPVAGASTACFSPCSTTIARWTLFSSTCGISATNIQD